jgi:hypothetical protein
VRLHVGHVPHTAHEVAVTRACLAASGTSPSRARRRRILADLRRCRGAPSPARRLNGFDAQQRVPLPRLGSCEWTFFGRFDLVSPVPPLRKLPGAKWLRARMGFPH